MAPTWLYRGTATLDVEQADDDAQDAVSACHYTHAHARYFSSYTLASLEANGMMGKSLAKKEKFAQLLRERMVDSLHGVRTPTGGHWTPHWNAGQSSFESLDLLFQQRYTGSSKGFFDDMLDALRVKRGYSFQKRFWKKNQAARLFDWVDLEQDFQDDQYAQLHNPVVSLSKSLDHALRYATGGKNYHHFQPRDITDSYDLLTMRPYADSATLGELQVFKVPNAVLLQPHVHDVQALCTAELLNVNARILSEEEVSFYGYIESRYAASRTTITLPRMNAYAEAHQQVMSEGQFDKWKQQIQDAGETDDPQEKAKFSVNFRTVVKDMYMDSIAEFTAKTRRSAKLKDCRKVPTDRRK